MIIHDHRFQLFPFIPKIMTLLGSPGLQVTEADVGSSGDLIAGAESRGVGSALWETAMSLKRGMRWEALYPDVITYNTLLSASTGRWEDILRRLESLGIAWNRLDRYHRLLDLVILTCADQWPRKRLQVHDFSNQPPSPGEGMVH